MIFREGWYDMRSGTNKTAQITLDKYHNHPGVQFTLNHGSTFIATPASARQMAERLLTLARIAEGLEVRDGQLRRREIGTT